MSYEKMNKSNTDFETFKRACIERAKKEPDIEYALKGISDEVGMRSLYNQGESVESTVYLLCF